jgi:hypothetical protein
MRSTHIMFMVIVAAGACSHTARAQEAQSPSWVAGGTCTLRSPEAPQQPKFLLTVFSSLDRENQRQLTSRLQITAADASIPAAASLKGLSLDIQPAQWTDLSGKVDIVDGLSMITVAPKVTPAELVDPIKVARTLVLTLPEGASQISVDLSGSHEASGPLEACIAALPG